MQPALFIQGLQMNTLVNYSDKKNEAILTSFEHNNKLKFDFVLNNTIIAKRHSQATISHQI